MQWWRLGTLRNKINGTLNTQNSLLICTNDVIYDFRKQRSIENLLFHNDNRIGCTVVPKVIEFFCFLYSYKYYLFVFLAKGSFGTMVDIPKRLSLFSNTY